LRVSAPDLVLLTSSQKFLNRLFARFAGNACTGHSLLLLSPETLLVLEHFFVMSEPALSRLSE